MLLKAIRKIDHLKGKDVSKIDKTDLSTNKSQIVLKNKKSHYQDIDTAGEWIKQQMEEKYLLLQLKRLSEYDFYTST